MGNVCRTCTHDDAAGLNDTINAPLLAPNPDAATGSYGTNAALARQPARQLAESEESEAEVRALRAQAEEENRSPEAKTGGAAAASSSEERRLEVERQGATDRKVIVALRVELEQARKDAKALQVELEQARSFSAGGESVAVVGGGALPHRLLPDGGEQKVEAPDTVLARDVDSVPHVASDPGAQDGGESKGVPKGDAAGPAAAGTVLSVFVETLVRLVYTRVWVPVCGLERLHMKVYTAVERGGLAYGGT